MKNMKDPSSSYLHTKYMIKWNFKWNYFHKSLMLRFTFSLLKRTLKLILSFNRYYAIWFVGNVYLFKFPILKSENPVYWKYNNESIYMVMNSTRVNLGLARKCDFSWRMAAVCQRWPALPLFRKTCSHFGRN